MFLWGVFFVIDILFFYLILGFFYRYWDEIKDFFFINLIKVVVFLKLNVV